MFRFRFTVLRYGVLFFMLGIAACGTSSLSSVENQTTATDGLNGGGDEPTTLYHDPHNRFSFAYPQSWSAATQPGEEIRLSGRDEFMSVALVSTTLSPTAYANQDLPTLSQNSPGFVKKGSGAYQVAAQSGAMTAFTWNAGPSPVTGKTVPSSAKRYYIPGASGTLAIFTYSCPNQTYDPAGADDFANAFRWLVG